MTLLTLPLLSLVGLWSFAAVTSLGPSLFNINFATAVDKVALRVVVMGRTIETERAAAAVVAGSNGLQGRDHLRAAESATDQAVRAFRSESLPFARDAKDIFNARALAALQDLDRQNGGLGALRARQHFGRRQVRQTIVEMDDALFFISAAGNGSCLAVLSDTAGKAGLVAYEMAMLIKRMHTHLTAAPRSAPWDDGPATSALSRDMT